MVRRLFVSVAIILAAIPLRAVKLSRKQGTWLAAMRSGHEGWAARETRNAEVVVSTGELS